MTAPVRIVRTRRGARLVQDGLIVSEVLARPGATQTLFDVLAATVAGLAPGPTTALLGFAAGGVVAPLRAMGFAHPLEAVDLDVAAVPLFRELSAPWCGRVRVARADAADWLRRRTRRYHLILEDLSADTPDGVTKPPVSLETLPRLMKRRLLPGGIAVTNVLPVPGRPWRGLLPRLARPFRRAHVVLLEDWENRVLIAGDRLPNARTVGRALRHVLRAIGSREAERLQVRALRPETTA